MKLYKKFIVRDMFDSDMYHVYTQYIKNDNSRLTIHNATLHIDVAGDLLGEHVGDTLKSMAPGSSVSFFINAIVDD